MSPASGDPEPPSSPERFEQILRREAPSFGLAGPSPAFAALSVFLAELDRWRRRANLTGNLTAQELSSHALESLLGNRLIIHGARVIDIGSGAGFPGVPIAIERRDIEMTLVEPRGKRTAFLRHVARQIPLPNLAVSETRIEEVGGQTFDVATTRAVGGFSSWIGEASFLEPEGLLLAWTTEPGQIALELKGFEPQGTIPIPASARRQIAIFKKRP